MPESRRIKRTLISVYDKTGIVDFARTLHEEFGIELISTGGTARVLSEAGLPVTLVEQITGFPEMLDGRVKTLHPKIHAAILADRDNPEHMRQLAEQGIEPIDMVVVNLYPFEKTIAKPDCTFDEAIEMIDIGGPCLLRAAAKSAKGVFVVPGATYFRRTLRYLRGDTRFCGPDWPEFLRTKAFQKTAAYEIAVHNYLGLKYWKTPFLPAMLLDLGLDTPTTGNELCYGENPHQRGSVYCSHHGGLEIGGGAEGDTSFNNYADASAAAELCAELTRAAAEPAGSRYHSRTGPAGSQYQISTATAGGIKPHLWYRLPAGSGVPPASSRTTEKLPLNRIQGETFSRRYLPHIQNSGRSYFVTFRTLEVQLPPEARSLVLAACRYWHGRKMSLHAVVVMPDHVHLLLTPWLHPDGSAVPLAELTHSIKSFSSNQVNRLLGRKGPLWMQERWDRIMRHEREFAETWDYIKTNPERAGLGEEYAWTWVSEAGFEEGGWMEPPERHRLEADTTSDRNRRDAGATQSATQVDTHRAAAFVACCFIKHTNACGTAVDGDPIEAYRRAYLGDPNAAMGGILAVNFAVDEKFAEAVMETYQRWCKPLRDAGHPAPPGAFFVEVWVAPSFDEEAVRIIRGEKEDGPKKAWGKRVRLLEVGDMAAEPDPDEMDLKRIAGGVLMQTRDLVGLNEDEWKVVTRRPPSEAEMDDLRLAWLICKHTKSNAITICKDGMLIGNGAGQMSRVMSCRIATWLAQENGHADALKGSAAASDAFFPFRDGPQILIDAGVTAIIQPGGSKRDADTIALCDDRGVAMIFTGTRHFKH